MLGNQMQKENLRNLEQSQNYVLLEHNHQTGQARPVIIDQALERRGQFNQFFQKINSPDLVQCDQCIS